MAIAALRGVIVKPRRHELSKKEKEKMNRTQHNVVSRKTYVRTTYNGQTSFNKPAQELRNKVRENRNQTLPTAFLEFFADLRNARRENSRAVQNVHLHYMNFETLRTVPILIVHVRP